MEIIEKLLALGFSILILLQGFVARRHAGTWLTPAGLFSLFWFGFTFVPLLVLFTVPIHALSIVYILACAIAFTAPSLAFPWRQAFERNKQNAAAEPSPYDSPFLRWLFIATTLTAIIFIAINAQAQGISLSDLLSDPLAAATTYAVLRTREELEPSVFGQLSIILSYISASLGGLLVSTSSTYGKRWIWISGAFAPAIVVALTQSAKGLLFLSIAFFYGGVLVAGLAQGRISVVTRKAIKPALISAGILLVVIVASFMTRGLRDSDTEAVLDRLAALFTSYFFAHLYAFSDWFHFYCGNIASQPYQIPTPSNGFYTLMSIFRAFGTDTYVPPGLYDEYFSHGDIIESNIYTIFRGLLTDFGTAGSLIFMALSGALFNFTFYLMLTRRRMVLPAAIFIVMVGHIVHSFLNSVFMYNSPYATALVLWFILLANRHAMKWRPAHLHR